MQKNKAKVTRCKLATEAAGQFYSTLFNSTEADLRSIHHALQSDPTTMVVGCSVSKGEDHAKKSIIGCADSVVISCITYQNGIGDEISLLFGALALDSRIQSTKTILYSIMEIARVWTTDVDNADQAVNFSVIVSQWVFALSG